MHSTSPPAPYVDETKTIPSEAAEFFRRGMDILDAAGVPFLVGCTATPASSATRKTST
jgi:hypothetical protein